MTVVRLAAIGLAALLGQVVLLRELDVASFGSELIYILALGVWLAGTALGAALARGERRAPGPRVRLALLAGGALVPALAVAIRGLRIALGGVPGGYLPLGLQMVGLAAALLPSATILGAAFPWAARDHVARGGSLAGAYAVESLGAIAGGVLATALLWRGSSNLVAALVCGAITFVAAGAKRRDDRGLGTSALALAGLAGTVVALTHATTIDAWATSWSHPTLVSTRDTPYGRVAVTEAEGQVSVFENDALAFESEGTSPEEFAHLAALQHPAPLRVLVLGSSAEGLVREVLAHGPERVDVVELDRGSLDAVVSRLRGSIRASLADPRVTLQFDDPRRFLATRGVVDLILVGAPEPGSGRTNRFYTEEFFRECAVRLAPRGVLGLRLPGPENLWTPQQLRRTASVHRALSAVFADVVLLPGTTQFLLASPAPLARDPEPLAARLAARRIETRRVTPAYLRYLYTNDRFEEAERRVAEVRVGANSDLHPVCYGLTLSLWLSRFVPRLALFDPGEVDLAGPVPAGIAVVVLVVTALTIAALRRRTKARLAGAVGAAGWAGMMLEAAFLLDYQSREGVLYGDLGLLLTLAMAGLAAGAAAARPWKGIATGAFLGGALALLAAGSAALLASRSAGGAMATGALLFATGFLVAAVFVWAASARRTGPAAASPLYAADVAGGAAGSVIAGLVTIPLLGIPATLLAGAALAIVATILALPSRR